MLPDYQRGGVKLYCRDCVDVLQLLEGAQGGLPPRFDLVTDPPYGIGEAAGKNKSRGLLATAQDYGCDSWTISWPSRRSSPRAEYHYELPPTSCWLVWDKMNGDTDFADCELAWTNLKKAVRIKHFRWQGMLRDEKGKRVHPTQKPVAVMQWAVHHLGESGRPVLDPFTGSGTTGVACVRLNRDFVGIERERKYFDTAVERIDQEFERLALIEPPPPRVIQPGLFDG